MKHSTTSNSRWRLHLSGVWGGGLCCRLPLPPLVWQWGGGERRQGTTASSGSNVVTGTMPMEAVSPASLLSDQRSFFAQLWNFLTTEPLAYAIE